MKKIITSKLHVKEISYSQDPTTNSKFESNKFSKLSRISHQKNPRIGCLFLLKFTFSNKATKIDKIFTVFLTLCSKCQIDGEDFVNLWGLLKKHELYFHQNNHLDCNLSKHRKTQFKTSLRIYWTAYYLFLRKKQIKNQRTNDK